MESALGRTFQKQLQAELDPVWHQLSWKTKQLVADLRTLRTVILYLTQVTQSCLGTWEMFLAKATKGFPGYYKVRGV